MSYGFKIMVEGDYACFTRPEMKVERVSYDIPTPGAIEGMIKSVYWKPAIRYVVDKIVVFNPINFANIRRNEVKDKISLTKIKSQINGKGGDPSVYVTESRTQRSAMVLKNVKYGIEFHFELTNIRNEKDDEGEEKHYNILIRRLKKGQHFRVPCLGCCEFPVKKIELVDEFDLNEVCEENRNSEVDFGFMSYKVMFEDNGVPKDNNWEKRIFSDRATTAYYRPCMINGVVDVAKYREVMKC